METRYHIYANNKCLNYNLTKEEFDHLWNSYLHMTELHKNFDPRTLSYEEVVYNKKEYSIQGT